MRVNLRAGRSSRPGTDARTGASFVVPDRAPTATDS